MRPAGFAPRTRGSPALDFFERNKSLYHDKLTLVREKNDLVAAFVDKCILVETTGFQRNRMFVFAEYLGLFSD